MIRGGKTGNESGNVKRIETTNGNTATFEVRYTTCSTHEVNDWHVATLRTQT